MWKVYKRTCPNGRVYIGITSRTLEERMQGGYTNNLEFAQAIKTYGKENIVSEVLEEYESYDDARDREKYYIAQYAGVCYNRADKPRKYRKRHTTPLHSAPCTETSSTVQNSDKTPAQCKQYLIPITEKPLHRHTCPIDVYDLSGRYIATYPTSKSASKATHTNHGDIVNCCKGEKPDGKRKYQANGFIFRYAIDKLDQYPDEPPNVKAVKQYTQDGEYIRTFPSVKSAWEQTGAPISSIGYVCRGLQKTAGGYIWKYA